MAHKNKTNKLWNPSPTRGSSISVIERGDPADDRAGVPFGFSRVLQEEPMPVFRKEADQVEITSNTPRKDPTWTYTDKSGHFHFAQQGTRSVTWPTIEWYVDSLYYCNQCEEDHEDGHWVCPLCLETIEPEMISPAGHRQFVPSMTHFYIDDVEVDENVYRRGLAVSYPALPQRRT